MKKFVNVICVILICVIFVACSNSTIPISSSSNTDVQKPSTNSSDSNTVETESNTEDTYAFQVSVFGIEKGVVYYDVFYETGIIWNEDTNIQHNLAVESILHCARLFVNENADAFQVFGYNMLGDQIFSWGGIDGVNEIRFYEDNKYSHNTSLTNDEIDLLNDITINNNEIASADLVDETDETDELVNEDQSSIKEIIVSNDNVFESNDVKIEITKYAIIPIGIKGNEYGEEPVIAFWYKTTNLTGNESVSASSAWFALMTVIQDNNSNIVNELKMAANPDEAFYDTAYATIKKDGTIENAVAYYLSDLETPITIVARKGIGGEEIGRNVLEIK